jgi:hypothetical protein
VAFIHNEILFSHKKTLKLLFVGKCMELENMNQVRQIQKAKGHMFSLIQTQYKYKHYIHTEIHMEHVCNSATGRGDQGRRKRRKERW